MNRRNKHIMFLGSLITLGSIPFIAAKCNDGSTKEESKNNETRPTNSSSNQNQNKNGDTNGQGQAKNDKDNLVNNNNNNNSRATYSDDEVRRNAEAEARKLEEAKKKQQEEERKLKEAEDKKNVVEIQKIVEEQKDAFGSFHSQKDFVDQINVYAKDKKISGLTLQNEEDGNKSLAVDTDGGKKNKIKLQLGSQKFEVNLGIVLKDAVITKFYYEDNHQQGQVMNNLLKANGDSIINKTWTNYKNGKNIVIKQLGYHRDHTGIKLTVVPHYTSKVPKHLPLKISSINLSFYNLESLKIDNINEWDLSNVQNAGQAFLNAKHFSQDLSQWKLKSGANTQKIFEKANKMNEHLDKIAKTWNVEVSKLK
ncbi:BspA family leucine-rich repeat surface protein [Mycoplasmopsis agalactiae]|uniref:BspA family leucine-rich repeat surface protein n=1 Tax=Mycoplasmopsis agalactiae TaxID=2110 RepID=UPI002F95D6D5